MLENASSRADLDAQMEEFNRRLTEQRERLNMTNCEERQHLLKEMEALREELRRRQGNEAIVREEMRTENDTKVRRVETEYDLRLTRNDEVHKAQFETMRLLHEEQVERLRRDVRERDERMEAAQNLTNERVEALFGSLVGNSAKRGDVGENLVKSVHDVLELGELTKTNKIKAVGYADHDWDYNLQQGDLPPIRGLIEVKFSHDANAKRDVNKFRADVKDAAASQRSNMAMYISLVERLAGKAHVCVEVMHGIPVLWASRGTDDAIPAATLVEFAFKVFAHLWPFLTSSGESAASSTLQTLSKLLTTHLAQYDKMDTNLRALDKAGESIRLQTNQLRSIRDCLVAGIQEFQIRHPNSVHVHIDDKMPVTSLLDTDVGQSVLTAVRAHYDAKKRTPSLVKELDLDPEVNDIVSSNPDLFALAKKRVKEENKTSGYEARSMRKKAKKNPE